MTLIPPSFHADSDAIPFANDWAGNRGVRLKLLMADIEGGRFAVRIRFAPGIQLIPHKHTGEVHAFTLAGEWWYLESGTAAHNRAGSYLFEPPGSIHTLKVADHGTEETDVIFIIYGAMLHLDVDGRVLAVGDAESHLREWPIAIRDQGDVLEDAIPVGGAMSYHRIGLT